jgi:ATP-dependent protease HslVU (ClpYQ) peptidase subunit
MTVIASIVENGNIWMASDQQSSGFVKFIQESHKVFRNGDFLIGVSGTVRITNLLRHSFEPPKRHPDVDIDKFMATEFVNAMRLCLQNGGQLENSKGVESAWHSIVVGHHGKIFIVDCDFAVVKSNAPWMATGSGGTVALGSLWATSTLDWTPEQRLENAVQAAIAMDVYCGGRPEIIWLPAGKEAA